MSQSTFKIGEGENQRSLTELEDAKRELLFSYVNHNDLEGGISRAKWLLADILDNESYPQDFKDYMWDLFQDQMSKGYQALEFRAQVAKQDFLKVVHGISGISPQYKPYPQFEPGK